MKIKIEAAARLKIRAADANDGGMVVALLSKALGKGKKFGEAKWREQMRFLVNTGTKQAFADVILQFDEAGGPVQDLSVNVNVQAPKGEDYVYFHTIEVSGEKAIEGIRKAARKGLARCKKDQAIEDSKELQRIRKILETLMAG